MDPPIRPAGTIRELPVRSFRVSGYGIRQATRRVAGEPPNRLRWQGT